MTYTILTRTAVITNDSFTTREAAKEWAATAGLRDYSVLQVVTR